MKLYSPNVVVAAGPGGLRLSSTTRAAPPFRRQHQLLRPQRGRHQYFPQRRHRQQPKLLRLGRRARSRQPLSGDVLAEGDVVILDHGRIWRGTNAIYNFNTGEVRAGAFKTVEMPFNLSGQFLAGDTKNQVYSTADAIVTTDDYAKPVYRIHARTITIVPGQYFEAHDATLYLGAVPVFYWPYYHRSLGKHPDNFEFVPGYRSTYGAFLLSAFNWYGDSNLDGTLHLDERTRRGLAGGPDLLFHLGDFGQAAFRYYYARDQDPTAEGFIVPHLKPDRQRLRFDYMSDPATNFSAKIIANYQSDPLVLRDFFEHGVLTPTSNRPPTVRSINSGPTSPSTPWPSRAWSTSLKPSSACPTSNSPACASNWAPPPFSTKANLPSATSAAISPTPTAPASTNYSATRADTVHQFTLPETFFGWLNVTPRVGGRFTYYSAVEGVTAPTNAQTRGVFNTGVDFSLKASKVYREVDSSFWDVHELRHIIEPDINYAYVPAPSRAPAQLPQFDSELPSLRQLPMEYPDYNSIDSIDKQNFLRLTLRNILQTKRGQDVEDFLNWAVYTDWNLTPGTNHTISDVYSDLALPAAQLDPLRLLLALRFARPSLARLR